MVVKNLLVQSHCALLLFSASTPHDEDAARGGRLGTALADDFRAVKTLHSDDVHIAPHPKAGKEQQGVVTAASMELGIEGGNLQKKMARNLIG